MPELMRYLDKLMNWSVLHLGDSTVNFGTVLFLSVSFLVIIFLSRKVQINLVKPLLKKYNLEGSPIEKLTFLVHLVIVGGLGIIVVDRSELDVTALQILQVLHQIMSEPLIPIGKTNVTLWTIVYIVVLSIVLGVITGRLQHWLVDIAFGKIKLDLGVKYGISMIAKYIVLALGFMVILQSAGIDLSSLTIMAGALGLGLSFGMQSLVANIVSGFTLLMERPVKVGDRIQVDGVLGDVSKIKLRATTIVTNDRVEIIVPNSEFITGKITNLSYSSKEVRFNFPVGVSYRSDPKQVKKVVEKVASENSKVLSTPPPELFFRGFGDSSLDFELRVWTRDAAKTPDVLRSELYYEIFDAFKKEGIEIPFPQRDLHIKSAIPIQTSS